MGDVKPMRCSAEWSWRLDGVDRWRNMRVFDGVWSPPPGPSLLVRWSTSYGFTRRKPQFANYRDGPIFPAKPKYNALEWHCIYLHSGRNIFWSVRQSQMFDRKANLHVSILDLYGNQVTSRKNDVSLSQYIWGGRLTRILGHVQDVVVGKEGAMYKSDSQTKLPLYFLFSFSSATLNLSFLFHLFSTLRIGFSLIYIDTTAVCHFQAFVFPDGRFANLGLEFQAATRALFPPAT